VLFAPLLAAALASLVVDQDQARDMAERLRPRAVRRDVRQQDPGDRQGPQKWCSCPFHPASLAVCG
jgi:hypothetical protein